MFNKVNNSVIEDLKELRRTAITSFNELHLIKNEELAEFFFSKFKEGQDVPYSILEEIPVGEALLLPVVYGGAIITTRQEDGEGGAIIYETKWTSGSTLTAHYHSDCNEKIIVKSGRIKVFVQNTTHILTSGQEIEVGHGIVHQVTALKESELSIRFLKIAV